MRESELQDALAEALAAGSLQLKNVALRSKSDARAAQAQAKAASGEASEAARRAQEAREAAGRAQGAADDAIAQASRAGEDAARAQEAADAAAEEAGRASLAAQGALDGAREAAGRADEAARAVEGAAEEIADAKARATEAAEAVEGLRSSVESHAESIGALVAAGSDMRTSIEQTAASIEQVASSVTETRAATEEAAARAQAAQDAADGAASKAQEAASRLSAAQEAASGAAQAAASAREAADDARARADAAHSSLAEAERALAEVESKADANSSEVAAARQAVEKAQQAADAASREAEAAGASAREASSKAEGAAADAAAAQAGADAAMAAAEAAQGSADLLAERVTACETSIEQNAEAIALRATKSEVARGLGERYTKAEADALLKVQADRISSEVSERTALGAKVSTLEQTASGITLRLDSAKLARSVAVSYAASASGTAAPSSGWQASPPAVPAGQHLWTRTVTSYEDGTSSTAYTVARQGADGAAGAAGAAGRGVSSAAVSYQASASGTAVPSGAWSASVPSVPAGQYLWTRTVTSYTDGTSTTSYSVARQGANGAAGADGATGPQGPAGAAGPKGDGLDVKDTRSTNQPPSWYFSNYPRTTVNEFKQCSTIGLSGVGTYCTVLTFVPWADSSGGYPKQTAKVEGTGKEYWRVGTSASAWSAWVDAYGKALDAAKTATNYLSFSGSGLVVGDMTAASLGRNVLIDSSYVRVRSGSADLARYGASAVELGCNSGTSKVTMCGGQVEVAASTAYTGMDNIASDVYVKASLLTLGSDGSNVARGAQLVAQRGALGGGQARVGAYMDQTTYAKSAEVHASDGSSSTTLTVTPTSVALSRPLPVASGGTGQATLAAARGAMGLGSTTGALPVANGGTGLTAQPSLLVNLASASAAGVMQASPRPGVTGTLPVANGGTGGATAAAARAALGAMGCVAANGYEGMARRDGNTSDWIRTTQNGIIPYQSGGHGSLGTSGWPFSTVYANALHSSGGGTPRLGSATVGGPSTPAYLSSGAPTACASYGAYLVNGASGTVYLGVSGGVACLCVSVQCVLNGSWASAALATVPEAWRPAAGQSQVLAPANVGNYTYSNVVVRLTTATGALTAEVQGGASYPGAAAQYVNACLCWRTR